tara:strand:+ start:233 stop:742 length:510 start_codon:yes stop_codon:yes gene_type:complete
MPDTREIQELKLDVGLLKRDINQTNKLLEKLSISIDKIQELNVNVLQMLSLHEEKLDQNEKNRSNVKNDIKELHSRVTTVSREVHERIDQVPNQITSVHERIDQIESAINVRLDTLRKDLLDHKKIDKGRWTKTISEVEKYKWLVLGIAVTAAFFLGKLDVNSLLSLVI